LFSYGKMVVMDMGFIRFLPEANTIDMYHIPTQEQFEKIRLLIRKKNGKINVEMNEDAYVEYDFGTPESFIINGIKSYYNDGKLPKSYEEEDEDFI